MPCIAIIVLLVGLNVGGIRDRLIGEPNLPRIESIAVLPLDNLSGDPEQEYFADGMTEALIADLAKISALRVISRQSVMRFKGTGTPLPEIAQDTKCGCGSRGLCAAAGDQVRITAQLVQAAQTTSLGESYQRN